MKSLKERDEHVLPSPAKCTEPEEETFFMYFVFTVPEIIDSLSLVIISGWMNCCPSIWQEM